MKDRHLRIRSIAHLRELYRKTDDPDFAVAAECLEMAEDAKVAAAAYCAVAVALIAVCRFAPLDGALRDSAAVGVACAGAASVYNLFLVRSNLDIAERCISEAESRNRP